MGTDRAPQACTLNAKVRPVALSGVFRFALEANSLSLYACCVMVCHIRFGLAPDAVQGVVSVPLTLLAGSPPVTGGVTGCGAGSTMACTITSNQESYSAQRIVCSVPPGVGSGWRALIRGQWMSLSSTAASVGFRRPMVSAVSVVSQAPAVPNTGGVISVTGSGFGTAACADAGLLSQVVLVATPRPADGVELTFDPVTSEWRPAGALTAVPMACEVLSWADNNITCSAPPGHDPVANVRVTVGGQTNASLSVAYAGPVVTGVTSDAPPSTAGGARITIAGSGFPLAPWPLAVTVGGKLCAVDQGTRLSTAVTCVAPPGVGTAPVVVHTALHPGTNGTAATVAYAAPRVFNVSTPQGRPIEGGFRVEVAGEVCG